MEEVKRILEKEEFRTRIFKTEWGPRKLTLPIRGAAADEGIAQILARAAIFARGVVTVAVFERTSFALPSVCAFTPEIRNAVNATAVISARIWKTVVCI